MVYSILLDRVVTDAISERNASIIAIAVSGTSEGIDDLPTVDDAVSRLDGALSDVAAEEVIDPERLALRRALNLPDIPQSMLNKRR